MSNNKNTGLRKAYDHLKDKLDYISEDVQILSGEDDLIELDPANQHHREWFDEDYPTPKERIRQSLIEMKLMREGKLPKKTWKQLREELQNE